MRKVTGALVGALMIGGLVAGGTGVALAGNGGGDVRVVASWVPDFAGDYTQQALLVQHTCNLPNTGPARHLFATHEQALDAKLAAGHYGGSAPVVSPTYDDLANALSSCPKG
jgi:hypothetical protein